MLQSALYQPVDSPIVTVTVPMRASGLPPETE
jgi:hypothetical protein